MYDATYDVTDDVIYDVTGRHFSRVFWIFRELSGMFVNVRDVFGVMVRGRSPCTKSTVWRMRERKRAIFSRAFFGFSVFFVVSYGCSRCLWCFGGEGEALV